MPDGDTDMTDPVQAELETESTRRGADELQRMNRRLEDLAAAGTKFHVPIFNKIAVPQTIVGRYSYAAAVFAVAFALRWLLFPTDAAAFITFFPAVVIATFLCGTGAGLLVTALSLLAGSYFYIDPYGSIAITSDNFSTVATFAIFGVLISLAIGKMLRDSGTTTLLNRKLNEAIAALNTDITERKQASQYARSLIEASLDPLVTISPDGKVMDVNEATVNVTGVAREKLIGSDFSSYFTEPDKASEGYQQVFDKGFVADYPLTISHRSGKLTDVLYNASVYKDAEGNVLGVFAAARDVTVQKRFENALLRNNLELEGAKQVAEKANLAKSEFLSSMSHELRTPLNAVLGFAQLIASGTPALTASQVQSVDQIMKAGWHLLSMINEILDLSLIESGSMSMSNEALSLAVVLGDCKAMTDGFAQTRGIQMTFHPVIPPLYVHADQTRLKQVLINLLSNAVKYNRVNGTVSVHCIVIAGNRVRICVKDTGLGLTPEQLAQLFQPFNRLGQEASSTEGSGIGLVVAKRLAELMDGTISVESAVGAGSEFSLELNVTAAPQLFMPVATANAPEPRSAWETATVHTLLYVEDNPDNLDLVRQLITRRPDLRFLSATDANRGIASARVNQPEIILMDINLPGLSGLEAMKILRADPATAHIPIVALSANAIPRDIAAGLKAGFFSYLTKPIKVDEFMKGLDAALKAAAIIRSNRN